MRGAIQGAIKDPDTPFQLEVFCTDVQSRRSLVVFRGTIGVWNGERQVRLDAGDRRALLQLLLDADFAGFEARYGGQNKADKQEAPLRAACRVRIAVAGIEKESTQMLDGEQSPELLGLATALLDLVEPRAIDGIAASNLENGLANLASRALAPELLELRLLRLYEDKSDPTGFILRIRGGQFSHQPYVPGELVGDIDSRPLDSCVLHQLVSALMEAQVWNVPRNLNYKGTTELEVAVLGFHYSVSARSSFRSADTAVQSRFQRLIDRIERIVACVNEVSCCKTTGA